MIINNINYVNINLINSDTMLIIPKFSSVIRSFIYDWSKDRVIEGPSISNNFRNKRLVGFTLYNGNVLYTKVDEAPNEYMIFDKKNDKFDKYLTNFNTNNHLHRHIRLKDGRVLFYNTNENNSNKIDYYLFY